MWYQRVTGVVVGVVSGSDTCGVRVTGVSESDTYGVRTWQVCVRKWQVWQKALKMVNGLRGIF